MNYLEENKKKRIIIRIPTYDKIVHFSDLEIHQEILSHSRFQFLWRISGDLMTNSQKDFQNFQNFMDMEITFSLYTAAGKEVIFKGLITQMELDNRDGSTRGFLVTGYSHTIAMEDLSYSRMHLNKSLSTIAKDVLVGHIQGLWEPEHMEPKYTNVIPSVMQSNENSWEFMIRLAKRYGEFFYWDGRRLQFRLKESGITLKNGVHLRKFGMKAILISNKSALSSYDYQQAEIIKSQQEHTQNHFTSDLMKSALDAQGSQYRRKLKEDIPYQHYTPAVRNEKEIENMTRLGTSGKASRMVIYSGITAEPINIGNIITIDNDGVLHDVIITKCTFRSVGIGNLNNEFEGIPADCIQPAYTDPLVKGFAYDQPAVVIDNNDPEEMGRIRVKYFWSNYTGENESDWIRVQTPHAGAGKGFYFTPELDEEVRVSFEGNNPDAPYVNGANYNGKAKSGYASQGNILKVIETRSGIKITFNDAEGSLTLQDPSGNIWCMDGKENITVTAPNIFTVNATDINLNASGNMITTVAMNKTVTIGMNNSVIVGLLQQLNAQNIIEKAENLFTSESLEYSKMSEKVNIVSQDENIVINTSNDMKIKSGEKTSNS